MSNILTEKIKIKNCSDYQFVEEKVNNYSYAFRKIYKHFDLIKNEDFRKEIKRKYNLNEHEFRSLLIDTDCFIKGNQSNKTKKEQEIIDLIETIQEINKKREKQDSKKLTRICFKLNKKLQEKSKHLADDSVFGTRSLLKQITHLHNQINNNLSKDIEKDKDLLNNKLKQYRERRKRSFYIVGEMYHNGNRNFDLSNLSENKVILKYNKIKVEIELVDYHNKNKILSRLEEAAKNNEIPITISLDTNYIYLTYDLEKLNKTNINEKERKLEVKEIKNSYITTEEEKTQLIKEVYKKYYRNREDRIISDFNKIKNRVASVDLNPENIGFSVLEYDEKYKNGFKVIHASNYDLSELSEKLAKDSSDEEQLKQNNKRKHEIIQVWKQIFNITNHYKCSFLIHEELEFKSNVNNENTKEANRKTKNIWHRNLTEKTITKYCNQYGLIEEKVNPCYTSFVGNLSYNYIDPINSSIEIGRRYFYKFINQEYYPVFDIGTIMNTMQSLNVDGDVSFLKDCSTWVSLYKSLKKQNESAFKFRWRRLDKDTALSHVESRVITRKSKVMKINFHKITNKFL